MTGMETRLDTDTTNKVELINKKIDEINQRRNGLRTVKIEDDLDRQELDDYVNGLHLTAEQKKLVEGYNKTDERTVRGRVPYYHMMMFLSVFVEAYLGYAIIQLYLQPNLDIYNTIYLGLMVVVFIINAFYVLKFLRILK